MNAQQVIDAVRAFGMSVSFTPDTMEYRVNFRVGDVRRHGDATAYYTTDPQDAICSARLMSRT